MFWNKFICGYGIYWFPNTRSSHGAGGRILTNSFRSGLWLRRRPSTNEAAAVTPSELANIYRLRLVAEIHSFVLEMIVRDSVSITRHIGSRSAIRQSYTELW